MQINNSLAELINASETAALLGVAVETLSVWRCTGRHNLPFVKCGGRVMYRRADLDAWLAARSGTSTRQIQSQLAAA